MGDMEIDDRLTIRLADIDDVVTIAEFNTRLAAETEGKQLVPATITDGVRTLLTDGRHGRYFVACLGTRIVGQMMHTGEWSDWRNGYFWWIQSVYVYADFRRQGVFQNLFRHVESEAKADPQVIGIRLYVEDENHPAHATYEKMGLVWTTYRVMERYPLNGSS